MNVSCYSVLGVTQYVVYVVCLCISVKPSHLAFDPSVFTVWFQLEPTRLDISSLIK